MITSKSIFKTFKVVFNVMYLFANYILCRLTNIAYHDKCVENS